jgi:hypothetical protein
MTALWSSLFTKLGCPMDARRRFHVLPRGSTYA